MEMKRPADRSSELEAVCGLYEDEEADIYG